MLIGYCQSTQTLKKEGIMPQEKKAKVAAKATTPTPKKTRGDKTPRETGMYASTGQYNPKAVKNVESYAAVCSVLPASLSTIESKIPQHTDFVGYLIRRGGIAPQ